MNSKSIFMSKTFWVNLVGLVALAIQGFTGWVVTPEYQAAALSGANILLRFLTKQPVGW